MVCQSVIYTSGRSSAPGDRLHGAATSAPAVAQSQRWMTQHEFSRVHSTLRGTHITLPSVGLTLGLVEKTQQDFRQYDLAAAAAPPHVRSSCGPEAAV